MYIIWGLLLYLAIGVAVYTVVCIMCALTPINEIGNEDGEMKGYLSVKNREPSLRSFIVFAWPVMIYLMLEDISK